jgi:hypothetical protein
MSTLNARARRVVEGARRAAEPTDGDRARVRAALIMRIGASAFNAPGGGGGSPANGASGASPVGSTLPAGRVAPTMFKGLGAVLLVGAAIFAAHMLTRQADPTAAVPVPKRSSRPWRSLSHQHPLPSHLSLFLRLRWMLESSHPLCSSRRPSLVTGENSPKPGLLRIPARMRSVGPNRCRARVSRIWTRA